MAFMIRDVNIGLLLLIIVSIILFSGFSVYYHTTFSEISLEYKTKLDQLTKVSSELVMQKQQLNETHSLKVKAEEDRKVLDSRYKDVNDENEGLKADNTNLKSEISATKSSLAEKSSELTATKNLLDSTKTSLSAANSQVSRLKGDLDEVCDAYTTLNAGVEHDEC